jgi:hypothetical protein
LEPIKFYLRSVFHEQEESGDADHEEHVEEQEEQGVVPEGDFL